MTDRVEVARADDLAELLRVIDDPAFDDKFVGNLLRSKLPDLRAALSAMQGDGWRGIETAPKRGDYLVFQPAYINGRTTLKARIVFNGQPGARPSTLWQPLPAPPKETPA